MSLEAQRCGSHLAEPTSELWPWEVLPLGRCEGKGAPYLRNCPFPPKSPPQLGELFPLCSLLLPATPGPFRGDNHLRQLRLLKAKVRQQASLQGILA